MGEGRRARGRSRKARMGFVFAPEQPKKHGGVGQRAGRSAGPAVRAGERLTSGPPELQWLQRTNRWHPGFWWDAAHGTPKGFLVEHLMQWLQQDVLWGCRGTHEASSGAPAGHGWAAGERSPAGTCEGPAWIQLDSGGTPEAAMASQGLRLDFSGASSELQRDPAGRQWNMGWDSGGSSGDRWASVGHEWDMNGTPMGLQWAPVRPPVGPPAGHPFCPQCVVQQSPGRPHSSARRWASTTPGCWRGSSRKPPAPLLPIGGEGGCGSRDPCGAAGGALRPAP